MVIKKLVGTANFKKMGNDLFWDYVYMDTNYNCYHVQWDGYDDAYWWRNVEQDDRLRSVGMVEAFHLLELDHKTNAVYLVGTEDDI